MTILRGHVSGLALMALLAACDGGKPPAGRDAGAQPATPPTLAAPLSPPVPSETPSSPPLPDPSESTGPPPLPVAYPPRDECAGLPGFKAFRSKVFAAAKAKDAEALVALADPKINLDFGGGSGPDELKKRLADPKTELWSAISGLAGLGCAVDGGVATMPLIFARLPEGYDDAASAMYGTGPRLPLRAGPARSARLLATLTWPVVETVGPGFDAKAPFTRVRLSDGTVGYMETARLRSLLDYRLVADRQQGDWRITALIAGD